MYICSSIFDSVAQLVEQKTLNLWVLGSSPSGVTRSGAGKVLPAFCFFYFAVIQIRFLVFITTCPYNKQKTDKS